ncbi:RTA1-domain-containing protein [Mycena crocata]|nr:RTA1-domain-containing protein [Mycena crocata]
MAVADSQYGYLPQEYIAALFVALFALSNILHIGQATYYNMWWLFPTPSYAVHDANCTTVVSPTPLIAVNFVLLMWMILQLGPCYARFSPSAYAIIFILSDVLALLVQAAGGSIAAVTTTRSNTLVGTQLMLAGIVFQRSLRARRRHQAHDLRLSLSTLVLMIRSIYRIIGLGTGWHGRIMRTEVYFCVLDGGMVALAMFTPNFSYPRYLMGPTRPEAPFHYGVKLTERASTRDGIEA